MHTLLFHCSYIASMDVIEMLEIEIGENISKYVSLYTCLCFSINFIKAFGAKSAIFQIISLLSSGYFKVQNFTALIHFQ